MAGAVRGALPSGPGKPCLGHYNLNEALGSIQDAPFTGSHCVLMVSGKSPCLERPAWAWEAAKGSRSVSLDRSLIFDV